MAKINKRLEKEYQNITKDDIDMNVCMINNNMFHWNAIIQGPEDSPYANGHFRIENKMLLK